MKKKTKQFFSVDQFQTFISRKQNKVQKIADKVQKAVAFESKGSTPFHIE